MSSRGLRPAWLFMGALLAAASLRAADAVPSNPPTETLTLKASMERADDNNARLLLAQKDLSVARMQLRQAQSLYYPKVNLNLDYVRYGNESISALPPESGGVILQNTLRGSSPDDAAAKNLYYSRLGFVQTLYAGGRLDYTYRLSQANVRRAESAYDSLKKEVELETGNAFYHVLALREEETILNDAVVEAEKIAQQAGSGPRRMDVVASQADFRKRLGGLRQQEETARLAYLRSMGLELFTNVDVTGKLDPVPFEEDLQTALTWAKEHRAELRGTQIQEEVDQLSVDLSLAERYPTFLLGGNLETSDNQFPLDKTNWNAVLSMTIPVFDGFSSWARVRESRYRADQGRLRRVQLEDQVETEVRTAHSECRYWKNEVDSRDRDLKAMKAATTKQGGLASRAIGDRLDALRWISNAAVDLVEARLAYCTACAQLAKAMGRPVTLE